MDQDEDEDGEGKKKGVAGVSHGNTQTDGTWTLDGLGPWTWEGSL